MDQGRSIRYQGRCNLRIATNYQSMVARRRLGNVVRQQSQERTKLSSGSRIYEAAFDPSGVAIATGMRARSRSNMQAQRNVNDGVSLLQVAEGTLSVMHEVGGRLRELAMQAANDTVGEAERAVANKEYSQLVGEIRRLTASTKFNGNHLINGDGSVYDLQIGLGNDPKTDRLTYDLKKVLDSENNFGLNSTNVLSKEMARDSFSKIDKMIEGVSASRAQIGGAMKRMESITQNLQIGRENLEASKSKIEDTEVANTTANVAKTEIMKNATTALLAQANSAPAGALKLLENS